MTGKFLKQRLQALLPGQQGLKLVGWISRSNPALTDAIVAALASELSSSPAEPVDKAYSRLSAFTARDWDRTEFWLDTSGLALYFYDSVQTNGMSSALDARFLAKLRQKHFDNEIRVAEMFQESISINRSFRDAGVRYANLKGFTLFPRSCPNLSLRYQSDHDFLIAAEDLAICHALLEQRGYMLTASTQHGLEFRSSGPVRTSLDGQYKAANRRSVELHLAVSSHSNGMQSRDDQRLDRLVFRQWQREPFPVLSPADQLIGQALHLLGHLRHEYTRPSWLLEYRHHIVARRGDVEFWNRVRTLTRETPLPAIALGLSTLLASILFGPFPSPDLDTWTVKVLPPGVRQWAYFCGRRAVLADVPGTKLYLLLEDALRDPNTQKKSTSLHRLIPLRRTDRILQPIARESFRSRAYRVAIECRFLLFRMRFHLQQGISLALEIRRWKRLS